MLSADGHVVMPPLHLREPLSWNVDSKFGLYEWLDTSQYEENG